MSENKNNICPCCPKGCDLSAPRCGRGEEYLRTGVVPERGNRNHHEEHQHPNYEEMGIDGKLFALLGKLGRIGYGGFTGKSSQNRILHILSNSECMTQRELTERLGIQPGSVSEVIKKLESAGLIVRRSNSEDRRTVDILLTDAGKARLAETRSQSDHLPFDALSEEEKQQLLTLLEKLVQHWRGHSRGEGRCKHGHHGEEGCHHSQGHGCRHGSEHRHGHKHGRDHDSN